MGDARGSTTQATGGEQQGAGVDAGARGAGRAGAGNALRRALGTRAAGATADDAATAAVEHKDAGHPVDRSVAAPVEAHLGVDLSGVKVHDDPLAREASAAMSARAFAHGADVFLGPGERGDDLGLMAHELTHVVQQGAAAQRAIQAQVTVGAADSPAERQADQVSAAVTSGQAPPATLIVDDGPVQPGQMLKSTFIAQLRERISAATADELGVLGSVFGCALIDQYFDRYANRPAAAGEALLRRYAPATRGARTAADMIPTVVARVREGVRHWRDTGQAPADLPSDVVASGAAGGAAPSGSAPAAATPAAAAPAPAPPDAGSPARMVAELGPGQPLAAGVAGSAGDALGASLAHVRVHTGPVAARMAAAEGAAAFTVGEHIAFADGAYQPGTPAGDALIAHELAHVVQQDGAGPAAAQRKPVDGTVDESAEAEADQAAAGIVGRMYGGARSAIQRLTRGPMALRRCKPAPVPSDPFVARLHQKLHASPRDIAGFWTEIGSVGVTRAGDAVVRTGLQTFVGDGKLSWAEAFRAVAMLELGPERGWPLPVKNFAEGVDAGTFTVSALPPAGADPLREFCVNQAGITADGTADLKANYRNAFNARWDSSRFSALSADFDNTLDSKGPRNRRARAIFTELYADPAYHTAYDTDTPAGFREVADTHVGPDGINLTASKRLQELRATLAPPTVTATGTGDAAYTALVAVVRPKAEALDARDRQEIERSHAWRGAVDAKVAGATAPVTAALRSDLWSVVTTSRPAVAPAPPGPPPVPPAPEPVPTPNPAQTAFLGSITLAAPASPSQASSDNHGLTFAVRSSHAGGNPGLGVRRKLVVEPAAQVLDGQQDERAWPSGSSAVDHTAHVNPEPIGAAVNTTFTAKLTMPPLPTATFAEKTATVTVEDKRLDWFKNNIQPGVIYTNQNQPTYLGSGNAIAYHGGQMPIRVTPELAGGASNPGLNIQMDGTLKQGGAVIHTFTRTTFGARAPRQPLFDTILREPAPPPAAPQAMEVTINFYKGGGAVAFPPLTLPFTLAASPPVVAGGDATLIANDTTWLNRPIATAGTLLHFMHGQGGASAQVANAVSTGVLQVKACVVRSDSATVVAAAGRSPTSQVAYAMGAVDPPGVLTNTLIAQPGAAGWRWPAHPNTVFLNATPVAGGAHRSLAQMSELLTHEGIHAADRIGGSTFDRYATEFRAYWIMGVGAGQPTAFDPTMSGLGPKAPRARAIFNHVYGSPTYPFVKPNYDANTAGFRDKVDNLLYPDGINLTLTQTLAALRREVEAYTGVAATYSARRTAIVTAFGACTADDRREITGNRDWRDLVEQKFTTRAVAGAAPPITERDDIKTVLGIPR